MEKLLQPDFGLMIWTAVSFIILLAVLGRYAWKPILEGLEKREKRIRDDIERAEKSQKEAEALRLKYEADLTEAQRKMQDMVNGARLESEKTREKLLQAAKEESDRLIEKGRRDLEVEADRLKEELKKDVADISLQISEKIVGRSVDKKVAHEVMEESLAAIRGGKK